MEKIGSNVMWPFIDIKGVDTARYLESRPYKGTGTKKQRKKKKAQRQNKKKGRVKH